MNRQQQVGKTVANFPPFLTEVGKLANGCQLQLQSNQWVTEKLAIWQIGNAANLPTYLTHCPHSIFPLFSQHGNLLPPSGGENTACFSLPTRKGLPESGSGDPMVRVALLCLDLGTRTGWALLGRDRAITSGTVSFQPHRFEGGGMRYLRFKRWLGEMRQAAAGLDALYFEEVRRHAGVDAAHVYGGFLAHLTAWCEQHQIPYQGVPVGTIKKHATGKGNAGKADIIAALRARGYPVTDDNEADALALLGWALDQEV